MTKQRTDKMGQYLGAKNLRAIGQLYAPLRLVLQTTKSRFSISVCQALGLELPHRIRQPA
jgi:hypothetical protein